MTKYRCNLCSEGTDKFCEIDIPDEFWVEINPYASKCPADGIAEWREVK